MSSSSSSSSGEQERFNYQRLQLIDSMLDEEENVAPPPRNRTPTDREREAGHAHLKRDYLSPNPTYNDRIFRRRFRMQIELFNHVLGDVVRYDSSFALRQDALGRLSLSPEQKITSVLRMLAYGSSADSVDEYCRMGASTTLACFKQFCNVVVNIYSSTYLREPNSDDMRKLLQKASRRYFPGMIGSIDYMHWEWRNCPTAWQGAYTGHVHQPTIILEAIASYNTWIWHAFFGSPGSNNGINVLGMSPVFNRIVNGSTPRARFTANGQVYDTCYYLADGIYPSSSTLVKTFRNPTTNKESLFAQYQEAYRKDVERAFGILQSRWAIVRDPGRAWDVLTLRNIMLTCIILHNMIIEDEQVDSDDEMLGDPDYEIENPRNDLNRYGPTLVEYLARNNRIRNAATHHALRTDLVEHVWNLHGNN